VRRISDIKPEMGHNMAGIYEPSNKTIYLAEQSWSHGLWQNNDDMMFVLRHEFGHAYNATANTLGDWLSDSPKFIKAFNSDKAKLSKEILDELQLSEKFKSPVLARDEVFADMYAHSSGIKSNNPYSMKLKTAFPLCLKNLMGEF